MAGASGVGSSHVLAGGKLWLVSVVWVPVSCLAGGKLWLVPVVWVPVTYWQEVSCGWCQWCGFQSRAGRR